MSKRFVVRAFRPGDGQTGSNPQLLVNAVVSMGRRNTHVNLDLH